MLYRVCTRVEVITLLSDDMDRAMRDARCETIEDGTVFATILGFEGLCVTAPTRAACEAALRGALEGWLLLGIAEHDPLPEVDAARSAMRRHRRVLSWG